MRAYIKNFDDYHDIDDYVDNHRRKDIKGVEIDLEDYGYEFNDMYTGCLTYYGLFYVGTRPSRKHVQHLIDVRLKGNPIWINVKTKKRELRERLFAHNTH